MGGSGGRAGGPATAPARLVAYKELNKIIGATLGSFNRCYVWSKPCPAPGRRRAGLIRAYPGRQRYACVLQRSTMQPAARRAGIPTGRHVPCPPIPEIGRENV